MQSTRKTGEVTRRTKKTTQDDLPTSTKNDEKFKRSMYSVSTPQKYLQKSSAADIYATKKTQAPKKTTGTPRNVNESPMKGLLKSSPSTSQITRQVGSKGSKTRMVETTSRRISSVKSTPRRQAVSNVTVNSPIAKRRLELEVDKEDRAEATRRTKEMGTDQNKASSSKTNAKDPLPGRQRTKTRTLEDDEVKILTPKAIENNAAMQDLARELTAKPKAFYVDLDDEHRGSAKEAVNLNSKSDGEEEEVSYEDDFESYESDFESYHSEEQSNGSATASERSNGEDDEQMDKSNDGEVTASKDVRDEERMLDSGNFELRESQRSASKKPAVMDFILEGSEMADDKKASLTDEGFQEMSSSSAVSSMRTVHTDVLERPLFIDFSKSKENKRKRKIFDKLRQRAKDILSMVTLHEMSFALFEMKPIPYDLYMATFGRKNYTQTGIQTFDDGITDEVQTDEVVCNDKWTQFPIEFSTNYITNNETMPMKKCDQQDETLVSKFGLIINKELNNSLLSEECLKNPLRVYLEQKNGAGSNQILPEAAYNLKLRNNDFNVNRLRKFLKKSESRISKILSLNVGGNDTLNLVKTTKIPFSKGYLNISPKNITEKKLSYMKYTKIVGITISETKDNLIMTYHKTSNSDRLLRYFICLWDTSVARCEPLKVLKATDNVVIGRYKGNTNGIFIAALEDCTVHLWDLSEAPTWCDNEASIEDEKATKLVEIDTNQISQIEIDREWKLRNSQVGYEETGQCMMQVSAYTSSGVNMESKDPMDSIVGLEFVGDTTETNQDNGRKIVGQICTLKRLGVLVLWSIIQEITTKHDIGKAYWSKIKLQKNQTVHLTEHLDVPINDIDNNFNLNAAKRRLSNRKHDRIERRKEISRPKSALLKNFDRSNSVASPRKNLPNSRNDWDNAIICNNLQVLRLNKIDNYLVAKSNGDVLCCKRNLGDFKIDRITVASNKSSITRLEVTKSNLPYFLAATESGTVNLCSILDARVLLTLDCRNVPSIATDRCESDSKGRFVASVPAQPTADDRFSATTDLSVKSVTWCQRNPFRVVALLSRGAAVAWELTRSDINAASAVPCAATDIASSRSDSMALVTAEGDVQIHRLSSENDGTSSIELFKKYAALL